MSVFYVANHAATTYAGFAQHVAARARIFAPHRGQVIGVWEENEPDFVINLFAIWRAGAVPFLVSRRLPVQTVAALLDVARAAAVVTPDVHLFGSAGLAAIPSACAEGDRREPAEHPPIAGEAEVAVILHTSGTTNLPKLVHITRAQLLASLGFEEARWRGHWTERDATLGWLPLFHSFGLVSELLHAYRTGSSYYFSEPDPRALLRTLQQAPITLLSSVPWMLERILELPGGAEALARLRWIVVGGAVVTKDLGERLTAAGARVIQQHGMTEIGAMFRGQPGGDWRDLHPVIPEAYWHLDPDGQLVIHADCPTLNSPKGEEFATRDTFARTSSGAVRYQSRIDDIVVHASGEKSNAPAIEQLLKRRLGARVEQLAVLGAGRLRLACAIAWKQEPTSEDRAALSAAIAEANLELPGCSQLGEDLVLSLAPSSGRALPLNAKGTVMRRRAEQELAADLDQLYARRTDEALAGRWRQMPAKDARAKLLERVTALAAEVRGAKGSGAIDPRRGFAEQGFDSLMAVRLRARLEAELGLSLSATLTFEHPAPEQVVEHLVIDVLGLEGRAGDAARSRGAAAGEPIAVVGAACRLPGGASDPGAFWKLLSDGRVISTDAPADRWDRVSPECYVTRGGFLDDVESFDAAFFRISPREAMSLDPQQRLLLEVCWEALERTGVDPATLRGSRTGVFVGAGPNEYGAKLEDGGGLYAATGNAVSFTAGRVAFFLGLHGPALAVDTACSSSLVALHLACESLRRGECERALVAGVNLLLSPTNFEGMCRLQALSPDGTCKTFSAAADGFARAEGCVALVLERLGDAERAGSKIRSLIRGTAVNHDGPSSGLTVPNGSAQQLLVQDAIAAARIDPADVDFVECHGTGTPLGDPIEVRALSAVYGRGRPAERPLLLGCAKANIGHVEAAAGLAGVLKAMLALEQERIPAQPRFGELNPHLPWAELPVRVVREETPWPRSPRKRLAAVSSFGLSGTNAHAVLEEAPPRAPRTMSQARSAELIVLSGQSPAAVDANAGRLREHLAAGSDASVLELALSEATSRTALEHRLAVAAGTRETLAAALEACARGETPAGAARGRASSQRRKVVFIFPGQGSQWPGMGRQLLAEEPVFRAALERCDRAIRAEAGWSVLAELAADERSSRLAEIDVVQPTLFAIEVALAALWRSWGVEPDLVVGHSMGESAAAHVAGALSLEDAVAIICRRSKLLRQIRGRGEMALVELSMEEAAEALRGYEERLSVAVSNSPRTTVLAGEPAALAQVLAALAARGVFCRQVKVDVASHSPQVDPLREELIAALAGLSPRKAVLPMRSTVTLAEIAGPELAPAYWADNLRQPVRFAQALQELAGGDRALFVEMSPHPILTTPIEEMGGVAVGSMRRGRDERTSMMESLGVLWANGQPVAWERIFPAETSRVELPTYAWQRRRWSMGASEAEVDAEPSAPDLRDRAALIAHVRAKVAKVLRLAPDEIDPERPFAQLGMDSLTAMELRNRLSGLGAPLTAREILTGASVSTLADLIRPALAGADTPASSPAASTSEAAPKAATEERWITVRLRRPDARVRLVCFPYAGGNPSLFAAWGEALPQTIEVGTVSLPGRASRMGDPMIRRMDELVGALAPAIAAWTADRPFAFFGCSLGALVMYEVADRLRRDHGLSPQRLFVAAARAPSCYVEEQRRRDVLQYSPVPGVPSHELDDLGLVEMLRDLGFGSAPRIARDPELKQLFIPPLRADLEIHNTYAYESRAPLDVPITCAGGRVDPFVSAEHLFGWQRHTTRELSTAFLPGGHYLLETQRPFWLRRIAEELSSP
jgi:acyl transferase domain-containing protein/surfactin synthase thioesterase subunit/acyl-CoA synthetase (AMP-forming)/AMP-acid ligase II